MVFFFFFFFLFLKSVFGIGLFDAVDSKLFRITFCNLTETVMIFQLNLQLTQAHVDC